MRSNVLGIFILVVAGYILVHNLDKWQDLQFGDETTYLASGLSFAFPFTGGAQWGPIYAAWYAFWHLFIPDSLDLYYFNWAILSVLAGVLTFIYFRALKVSLWISIGLAILFLFSSQNLPLNPKISIFPFCLILICLSVNQFLDRSRFEKFLLVSITGLICSYVRPEFYISFLCGAFLAFWFLLKDQSFRNPKEWLLIAIFIFSVFSLHLLFENPVISGEGNRSAVAFQQHFVSNYCIWKKIPDPVTIEQQIRLFHDVLGDDVNSFVDALIKQPVWTLKHVGFNTINTLNGNVLNLVDTFYHTLLRGWISRFRVILYLAIILLFLLRLDYRKTFQNLKRITDNEIDGLVAVLTAILPSLIATLLIFPRSHYLIFHLLLLFWLIAFVVNRIAFRPLPILKTRKAKGLLSLAGGLALVLFLSLRFSEYSRRQTTPIADNIRFISLLKPQTHLNILERDWYRVFIPYSTTWIQVEDYDDGDFIKFVKSKEINFILMTKDMQAFFSRDAGFKNFMANHRSEGFSKIPTNKQGDFLLVKNGTVK